MIPMLLDPNKRRINRPLVEIQGILRNLLEPAGDAVRMLRPHRGKGAENDQVQSALQDGYRRHSLHLAFN